MRIKYVEEQDSIVESAFKLLLSLQTPLKHEEFLQALSFCGEDKIDLSVEELLDLSCNFLVLDTELDVFRFAHLSIREYLETRSEYSLESSHALAAQFCLRYLCTSNTSGPFLIPRDPYPEDGAMLRSDSRVMSWKISPSQSNYDEDKQDHIEDGYTFLDRVQDHIEDGYPFLDRVQEYVCAYWADHVFGSRHLRLLHPLSDMLRNFTIDTSQRISPWFMYWNRLAMHMMYFPHTDFRMPGWSSSENRIIGIVQIPADYLFAASIWGFCDLLDLRLRSKPDPMSLRSSLNGYNALQLACSYGNRDVTELLLDRGWELQVENIAYSSLGLAVNGSHFETAKLLLSRGADPNEESNPGVLPFRWFPIFGAIDSGSLEVVKLLLDYGASADVENYSGLETFHVAAIDGKQEIADILLAASADADKFPRSFWRRLFLVHKATRNGDEDLLNTALADWPQGVQGNKYLDYALWDQIYRRGWFYDGPTVVNETCLKALLAKGADANCSFGGRSLVDNVAVLGTNSEGRTKLWASDFSVLKLLVDHGADLGKREFMCRHEVCSD